MAFLCRRCRREISPDAKVCDYCELENPLAEETRGQKERQAHEAEQAKLAAAGKARTRQALLASVAVIVVAAIGLYVWSSRSRTLERARTAQSRAVAAAPVCATVSILDQVKTLLLDNAFAANAPFVRNEFPNESLNVTESTESPTLDETKLRHCRMALSHNPKAAILGAIERVASGAVEDEWVKLLAKGDLDKARRFLERSWIRSKQHLEWSVEFDITRDDKEVGKPWGVVIPDEHQEAFTEAVMGFNLLGSVIELGK